MDLDEPNPRTLYVGNLDAAVTEELILHLFGNMGACKGCKIIHEANSDPYCFVEFSDTQSAFIALNSMHKRLLLGKAKRRQVLKSLEFFDK